MANPDMGTTTFARFAPETVNVNRPYALMAPGTL